MEENKIDPIGYVLIISLLAALTYAGYISYKSIDFGVLERMEAQKIILPTIAPNPTTASSSAAPNKP